MITTEYLDAATKATKSTSDYQLAKHLGLSTGRISDYRTGRIKPDEYACTRIAIALGLDPVVVIGDIAVEFEKSAERRQWWQDFLGHAGKLTVTAATLAMLFTPTYPNAQEHGNETRKATNGRDIIFHYAHYEMGKKPTKSLPQEGLTELLQAGYQGKLSTPRTPLGDIMDITEQALKLQPELAGRLQQTLELPQRGKPPTLDALVKEKEQLIVRTRADVEGAAKERDEAVRRRDERLAQRRLTLAQLEQEMTDLQQRVANQRRKPRKGNDH